jgi:drug/metabolite transporter (DMT)-like permease
LHSNIVALKIDRQSYIILFVLTIIWGCSFFFIKKALLSFTPIQAGCLRLSISTLTFLPFIIHLRKEIETKNWLTYLLVGLTGSGIPAILFSTAQTQISSSVAGMLNSLTPIWTLIVGYVFFNIGINKTKVIGVLVGFVGALSLIWFNSKGTTSGDNVIFFSVLIILATMCYGTSVNIVQSKLAGVKPIMISAFSFFLTGIPAIIYLLSTDIFGTISSQPQAMYSLGALTLLSVFGTVIASILFYHLVQKTSAVFASTVTYLMPIMSIIVGVLDGESFNVLFLMGIGLILIGIYLTKK